MAFILAIIWLFNCNTSCCRISETNQEHVLKVMSYNIRFGELASLKKLAKFIKSENPDLVALQEVDVRTYRKRAPHQNGKDFITELGYRTGMLTAYARTIDYAKGYYGIGILSKYPFLQTHKVLLPMPEGAKEQRAFLSAEIELPEGKTITFVCTHLDHSSSEVRIMQVNALNAGVQIDGPVIVAGDFNAQPSSPEIKKGMAGWKQAGTADFTIPVDEPRSKIDYIFCSPAKNWKVLDAVTPKSKLSDHFPVIAEVEWVESEK